MSGKALYGSAKSQSHLIFSMTQTFPKARSIQKIKNSVQVIRITMYYAGKLQPKMFVQSAAMSIWTWTTHRGSRKQNLKPVAVGLCTLELLFRPT